MDTPSQLRSKLTETGWIGWTALLDRATDLQLDNLLNALRTDRSHPLKRLLTASEGNGAGLLARTRTEQAMRVISSKRQDDRALSDWFDKALDKALDTSDYTAAHSSLAEIRCAGDLLWAGFHVSPIRTGTDSTPDFQVGIPGVSEGFVVEVGAKEMNRPQAKLLEEFHRPDPIPLTPGECRVREHVVQPAGARRGEETTAENFASKLATVKANGSQASREGPSIVWVDLVDEAFWIVGVSQCTSVSLSRGEFYSGGAWHAYYGLKDTPIFEGQSTEERSRTGVRRLGFDGHFVQSRRWSAAVLRLHGALVVFEHPDPDHPLSDQVRAQLMSLPDLDYQSSWFDWPPNHSRLAVRVQAERDHLKHLARVAPFSW